MRANHIVPHHRLPLQSFVCDATTCFFTLGSSTAFFHARERKGEPLKHSTYAEHMHTMLHCRYTGAGDNHQPNGQESPLSFFKVTGGPTEMGCTYPPTHRNQPSPTCKNIHQQGLSGMLHVHTLLEQQDVLGVVADGVHQRRRIRCSLRPLHPCLCLGSVYPFLSISLSPACTFHC